MFKEIKDILYNDNYIICKNCYGCKDFNAIVNDSFIILICVECGERIEQK